MADDDRTATEIRDDETEISVGRLRDDIRDALLTHVRSMETPWSKLSENDQRWKIDAITRSAEEVVRRCAYIMASRGFDHIPVQVGKFTVDERLKGVIEASASEFNVAGLLSCKGGPAILVLCDPADWMGELTEVKPEPDQPGLPIDEDNGEPDDEDTQVDPGDEPEDPGDVPETLKRRRPEAPAEPAPALS